jgi:hypothetical protein
MIYHLLGTVLALRILYILFVSLGFEMLLDSLGCVVRKKGITHAAMHSASFHRDSTFILRIWSVIHILQLARHLSGPAAELPQILVVQYLKITSFG